MFQSTTSPWWMNILTLLLGSGMGSLLTQLITRNKTNSEAAKNKAEAQKNYAEAERLRLSSGMHVFRQMERSLDRFALAEANFEQRNRYLDDRERSLQADKAWLREQIVYWEAVDKANRERQHELSGELGRLGLIIRNLELDFQKETSRPIKQAIIRTYDEIVKPFPLPKPPREL